MSGFKDLLGDTLATYPNSPGWQRHSTTSRNAAASMLPHFTKQQQTIIDYLDKCGSNGAIYDQICDGTGLKAPSVCGRMVELVEAKRVVKSDRTRPTASNRQARVYVLAEFANKGERHE